MSKTWTKCLTVCSAFYYQGFKSYFEFLEFLLRLLVVDDKFNGFDVSVCHNKNDALILVFPKISASLSDKKRHLNGLNCVSCYYVPKTGRQRNLNRRRILCRFSSASCYYTPITGRQRSYNGNRLSSALELILPRHRFLKSGARLGIMPKELKGLPYRISLKVLQIYGKIFIRAPFP